MRTVCGSILRDCPATERSHHSTICVRHFPKIRGCGFNSSAPVTTHQFLQPTYTSCQALLLAPIEMNLALLKKLLQYEDLCRLRERARGDEHGALSPVHQDTGEIHHVLERAIRVGEHHWWDILFRWSPTARGILCLHPTRTLLIFVLLRSLLNIDNVVPSHSKKPWKRGNLIKNFPQFIIGA